MALTVKQLFTFFSPPKNLACVPFFHDYHETLCEDLIPG